MAKNNITLTLDTIAPSVSSFCVSGATATPITTNNELSLELTTGAASTGETIYYKAWFSANAVGTESDTNYDSASWVAVNNAAATITTAFGANNGTYYYHVQLRDDVGNKSAISTATLSNAATNAQIRFDNTAPTITADTFKISDPDGDPAIKYSYTNSLTNDVEIQYNDNLSGVVALHLVGSGASAAYVTAKDITVSGTSATTTVVFHDLPSNAVTAVTVSATVTDAAGNTSTAATYTINYDNTAAEATLSIAKGDDDTWANINNTDINYTGIKAKLTTISADIVAYKVWGDYTTSQSEAQTNWIYKNASDHTQTWDAGAAISIGALTLTSTNGTKHVYAKVMDRSGNVSDTYDQSVLLDDQRPNSILMSTSTNAISQVSGYNSATITYSIADTDKNSSQSGIASWTLYCNNSSVATGTAAASGATFTVTSATTGLVAGANTFKIVAVDNAGNTCDSSNSQHLSPAVTVEILYDPVAPTITIGSIPAYANAKFDVPVTTTDTAGTGIAGAGVHSIYVWVDSFETSTKPDGTTPVAYSTATQTVPANSVNFTVPTAGTVAGTTYYVHATATDAVGNESTVANQAFTFDNVVPAGTVAFSAVAYSSTTASVTINYNRQNNEAPIVAYQLTGDISDGTSSWTDLTSGAQAATSFTRSVTLTTGDGNKTVSVLLKDAAGNAQTVAGTATCELDTSSPTGTVTLRVHGTSTVKPAVSNLAPTDIYITYKDDIIGNVYFKIWGDYSWNSSDLPTTEGAAEWIEINTINCGTITDLTGGYKGFTLAMACTSGDGDKYIQLRFKDDADNIFPAVGENPLSASFLYDTAAIKVMVSEPDHNRISTVHELIGSTSKYYDLATFTFAPTLDGTTASSEKYIEYKVCAYADETAAKGELNIEGKSAIGTANGSSNTSWSGAAKSGTITCVIAGRDLEIALGATDPDTHAVDGARIIVCYMKDEAGTWSGIMQTYNFGNN